jgi:D-alanyl-D-alanine carboxypeptidase
MRPRVLCCVRRAFAAALAAGAAAASLVSAAPAGPSIVLDAGDGTVLYAEDQDLQWPPASVTKVMTAYVVFEAMREGRLEPSTRIIYSADAEAQVPSKLGLPVGSRLAVETALQVLIVKSANDVAVMLAEAVSGTHAAFVGRMNATAARLGMTRTHFVNANGLPAPEQLSTARDLARLAVAVVRDYPEHAALWSTRSVKVGNSRMRSYNGLLGRYPGANGLKTGFVCDSGFNLVGSATRDGRRLIAVVLGAPTDGERTLLAANLLEHGFLKAEWAQVFPAPTLDTLAMEFTPRIAMTMRQALPWWSCEMPAASAAETKALQAAAAAQAAPPSGAAPTRGERWPPW